MTDIILFCPDTAALVAELREKFPHRLDEGEPENPRFIVDKTPTVRRGAETLALVRADGDLVASLESLASLTVLGTYEDIEADPDKRAIYDRVYPRTPIVWTDDGGIEHTQTPPEKIGVFA